MAKGLSNWGHRKTQSYLDISRKYYWDDVQLDQIFSKIFLNKISNVLDLGTGQGYLAFYLRSKLPKSAKVTGIDIDEKLLAIATKKAILNFQDIDFIKSSVYDLPFQDGNFDLITAQLLLLHLDNPDRALIEIYRCLKPGGFAFLVEANNTAITLVDDSAKKILSINEISSLTKLELAYNRGKNKLGEGDSNIGDLLLKYLAQTGFKVIEIQLVNRVNPILPPYTEAHREIFEMLYGADSYNQWKKLYWDYCMASGISKDEFNEGWKVLKKLQRLRRHQFVNNEYFGLDVKVDYAYLIQKM